MGLKEQFAALTAELNGTAGALGQLPPILDQVADKAKKAADAEAALNMALSIQKDVAAAGARAVGDDAESMTKAANAAANLRSKIEALDEAQSHSATTTAEGIQVSGQAQIIQIQAVAATKAQTDALIALLKEQNAYNDSVAHSLTVVDQWNNYLAILVSSYQNGATSLLAYRQALQMFQVQLEQTFAGATGKAKEGLDAMIQAIEKLIATAGAGPAPSSDQSPTGALNRAFA